MVVFFTISDILPSIVSLLSSDGITYKYYKSDVEGTHVEKSRLLLCFVSQVKSPYKLIQVSSDLRLLMAAEPKECFRGSKESSERTQMRNSNES